MARLVSALLVSAGAVLLGAPGAAAHSTLLSTTPAQGSTVDAAPEQVRLHFSENVGIAQDAVRVLDPTGGRVDAAAAGYAGDDRSTVVVTLRAGLPRASYAVVWRVVSADSHPVAGTFSFGVGVPAGTAPGAQATDPVVDALHWVLTGLWYAGAALIVGPSLVVALVWPPGRRQPRVRRLQLLGIATGAAATLGLFLVQGPYGQSRPAIDLVNQLFRPALLGDTLATNVGPLLLVRLLVLGLAAPVLGLVPDRSGVPVREQPRWATPALAAALALTAGLSGHPGQESTLAVAADAVHFVAATGWLGGLACLLLGVLAPGARADLLAVLPRWSRLAMGYVTALVVTGTYQAWREVGSTAALTGTEYGRLLLVKLAGLVTLLALAELGRRWVAKLPARRASADPGALRESVFAETVVGAVVLGLTAALTATVPARQAYLPPFSQTLRATGLDGSTISVVVDIPAPRPGAEEVHVYTYTDAGQVLPVLAVSGAVSEVAKRLGPVRFSLPVVAPGHATSPDLVVPAEGSWQLTLQVRTGESTSYAAVTTYPVRAG